jgi:exosortase D (VPLPA-CTERM-specific)
LRASHHFAYSQTSPTRKALALVSPQVQTESSIARSSSTVLGAVPAWQLAILGSVSLWLYGSTLFHLVAQWWHDPNFSHGFFVPLFSLYLLWLERDRLGRLTSHPSWSGLALLVLALCFLIIGQMGAELFLARFSLLVLLAAIVVLFQGWIVFRAVLSPWAFLLLMIPIPTIVLNQITFPLQLQASKVAAFTLPLLGVPTLREGNVINLPSMALEVAEACSGIRSLMSLITLAIIYGYLMEKRLWMRWILAVASVPIAIAANSFRIVGTGLLVQYWDPDKAQGFFHEFQGWLIFVVSLFMLYAVHGLLRILWPEKGSASAPALAVAPALSTAGKLTSPTSRFVCAAVLIAAAAIFLQARTRSEVYPPRLPLKTFPENLDGWTSTDIPIEKETLDILGPGDFLLRLYEDQQPSPTYVDLFIAYFRSQRAGDTIHSPQHCLPGAGWIPVENTHITLSLPGHGPFPANRYIIAKGDSRKLVLYWYWAHDRGVASEYWAKFYLVADSIKMNRSDGALVRITLLMYPGESAEAAEQRLLPFTSDVVPLLDNYIPR